MLGRPQRRPGIDNVMPGWQTPDHLSGRMQDGVMGQVPVDKLDDVGMVEHLHRKGQGHAGFDEAAEFRLRGIVTAPMRSGPPFLAGEAQDIAPPTGAPGLTLALGGGA